MHQKLHYLPRIAAASLITLIALGLEWELWLAPLRPGGSWLALKVLPLFFALRGVLSGQRYTYKWLSLLVPLYVCEGVVRSMSDTGLSRWCAGVELFLAIALFMSVVATARYSRQQE